MEVRVLPDILSQLVATHQKPSLLRYKAGGTWRDLSTAEVDRRIRDAALGLRDTGIERGDRVGLLSENRPEWLLADLALQSIGAVNVPIYPTLLPEQIQFILADCGARAILCSTPDQVRKIDSIRDRLPAMQAVVAFDPPPPVGGGVTTWESLLAAGGRQAASRPGQFDELRGRVQPADLASLIYTSGTTGVPKGVMLTHDNFLSNVKATVSLMPITEDDVALSFLPLSHVLQRMVEYCYLYQGTTIAYAESLEAVPQNLLEVRPSIVTAVPRVFEKFFARVMETVSAGPGWKRGLFHWARKVGRERVPYLLAGAAPPGGLALRAAIADRLVLRKLRERVGGRVKYFISGGAPLNPDLAEFFWGAGIPVYEGYGLTETSPVIAVNLPGRVRLGTVGPVIPGVEVRISDDGEILVRGPNVMQGYYRSEEANRRAFQEGWFCTGDIGRLDEDGFLSITDRKKDIIKTSGGKMVAPQPMENALKASKYIANAVVVGERRKYIAALIVPNFDNLAKFCASQGLGALTLEEQLGHPKVKGLLQREIDRHMEDRPRYEQIKEFRLLPRDFTLEAGEVTPKLNVRRNVVEREYRDVINSMYPDEPEAAGAS